MPGQVLNMDRSEKPTPDCSKTVQMTAELQAKYTGSNNDHRSRAKNNETADCINKSSVTDSLSPSSLSASNMKGIEEQNFSQDSGYQSDISVKNIGHRVGMGSFDLLSELAKVEPNLVRDIVKKASHKTEDLVSISEVSPTWQSILSPKEATTVDRHQAEQAQEKLTLKENFPKEKSEKRCVTESDSPLTEVQEIGKPQLTSTPKVAVKENYSDGRVLKFYEILFNDESMTKCARHGCQAPAKHLMNKQKGQCTSCQYEFCTNCRCEFHGGQPCQALERKSRTKKGEGIGSKKSKMNLKRIGNL